MENQQLAEQVSTLLAGLDLIDQLQVELTVDSYINLAGAHPEESRICTRDPHHALAALTERELYQASGLSADLRKICP